MCANEWSPSDGKVVSLDHGCGAHSEVDVTPLASVPIGDPIVDEYAVELVEIDRPADVVDESAVGDIAAAATDVSPADATEDDPRDA